MDRPLVTFALIARDQEAFVREALRGALGQTYAPLQILLSDDGSTDGTYAHMEEAVAAYRGPAAVVLNRNPRNLGIAGHINRIMALAEGELIVIAAGDDVSWPERTAVLVSRWLSAGKRHDSIHSSVIRTGGGGDETAAWSTALCRSERVRDYVRHGVIVGASHAWTRRVFERAGELSPRITREDRVIGVRSITHGGVLFVDQPLLTYRVGGASSRHYPGLGGTVPERMAEMYLRELVQMQADLLASGCARADAWAALADELAVAIDRHAFLKSGATSPAVHLIRSLVRSNGARLRDLARVLLRR